MYMHTYQLMAGMLLVALLTVGTYLIWTLTKDASPFSMKRKRN